MNNINEIVAHWIRPQIRDIAAYHVPDPGELIKLDAMENPYTWPEPLVEEWLKLLRNQPLNRYPDPSAKKLQQRLREAMDVPDNMEIMLGNGSDEIIQIIAMALQGPKRSIMAPEPSFVMYKMIATFCDMEYVGVPLNEDFSLNHADMIQAIEETNPAVIFLAYPNNPTGNLFDDEVLEHILQTSNGLVVIDEAYHAFAGKSYMDKLGQYDNLLVMRTLSKLGLAGLRLGLLAGPAEWLCEFDKVRLPYNINVLTQLSAEFALKHSDVFIEQTRTICDERTRLMQTLEILPDINVYPSAANFILFRLEKANANE
ncbi:MAG: histidinol-phosphate transaminase, partial [Gammaproteobacteria bacterium]|nr:histidinol-phosphate transaminase [Gammaproteobacteria bacterium]